MHAPTALRAIAGRSPLTAKFFKGGGRCNGAVKFQYERHEARKVDIANQSQTCEQTCGKLSPFDDNSNHAGLID